ncbi:group 1 truncated hemoglobin [Lysinimonas soli]|uniref:Group 1 truncated hemoglobin n=1 Tax=Lysinimonas soli TaxID=1074233 RepID=A0ABW0NL81_9MICO
MSMLSAAGGPDAIRTAVDIFDARMTSDPVLAHYLASIDMSHLRAHQKAFLLAALGGPDLYTGRDMRAAHQGLGISDTEFDLAMGHLAVALREANVSDDVISGIARRLASLRQQIVV